jgi:hypothetical protein
MASTRDRNRFLDLQRRWIDAYGEYETMRWRLREKYGPHTWDYHYSAAERRKLDSLSRRMDRLVASMYRLLSRISPRDWSHVVPTRWVMSELSFEDAITDGAMSVIPNPAYGYTREDARRFAERVIA